MLDGNELKFGDLLVEKGKECNSLFMFLKYSPRTTNIKLLKIPNDIYIPSVPVWKPDYESFLDSRYVRHHGFYRPILNMNYADPDQIKKHNDKANHYLNLGKWLYNCSLYPIEKANLDFKNGDHIKLKPVDEYLDTDGAKEDAEKFFKTACLMQGRSCGKIAFAAYQMKKYLEDHPDAKIVMPYHHGYSYYKELINRVYGCRSKHDDMPDAIRYAIEEFERKQREERLEKAKLTSEELKEMLNNSCYGVCWPSELIDACERIDKYRKEVEEMYKTLICRDVEFTADLYLKESGRTPDYDKKIFANVYAYDDGSGFDIRFKFYAGREWCFIVHLNDLDAYINDAYHAGAAAFNFIFNRIYDQSNGQITIKSTGANLSCIRHVIEAYDLFKTRKAKDSTKKETTEMKGYKFMVPKGAFGSKVYIQAKDSDKITYAGTLTDMHLETASGCEMHGNIDFIADDEPVEKLANLNRGFIKNVVFHDPATIVEWKDGTKTVVQVRDGEKFDPEKGLAMAISKKAMGNKRDYYHTFKHYLKKVKTESVCGEKVKTITLPEELAYDVMQFLKEKAGEKEGKNET